MAARFAGLRILALALSLTGEAGATSTVIHAGHLIAQPGGPESSNQSIVIEDGKITGIKDGFLPGDVIIELKDSWVMPGLIDMHPHVSGQEKLAQPVAGQIALAYLGRPAET